CPLRTAALERPGNLDLCAGNDLSRIDPCRQQGIGLHDLAELAGGLRSAAAAAPRPIRRPEVDRTHAARALALRGQQEERLGWLTRPGEQIDVGGGEQCDHGRVRTSEPMSLMRLPGTIAAMPFSSASRVSSSSRDASSDTFPTATVRAESP